MGTIYIFASLFPRQFKDNCDEHGQELAWGSKVHVLSGTCSFAEPDSDILRTDEGHGKVPVTLSGSLAAVSLSKTPDSYQSRGFAAWM